MLLATLSKAQSIKYPNYKIKQTGVYFCYGAVASQVLLVGLDNKNEMVKYTPLVLLASGLSMVIPNLKAKKISIQGDKLIYKF